jgi:hypothetical protein
MSRGRKRMEDMSTEELLAYERSANYRIGRSDAFDHGNPETILEYWERDEPTDVELRAIVRNLLKRAV